MLTSRKSAHGFALSLCLLVTRTALCSGGDSCPSTIGTEHQGFVHRSQCYQFVNRKEWWGTARDFCASKGGHLIQLDNAEVVAFIKGTLRGNFGDWDKVWIGANDRGTEKKWIWDGSDEEISYNNWGQGQPATSIFVGPFEDCATMEKADDYRWHDHACGVLGQEYQFICQYDAVNRTATTSTTTSSTITTETTTGTKTAKITTTTIRAPSSTTVAPPAPGNRTYGNHSTLSTLFPKTNTTTTTTTTMETPSASTPAVPPTRHSKTTGHHPTPSALLAKTTTATTKTSTTIRTTPSSSSSSTPVAPSTSDKSGYTCPQNLEPNYQTFTYRDHCYQFVTKEDWRSTAQKYCRKYQGQLIEIPDQNTMDFVIDVLNKKLKWGVNGVWNGASDQREEGVWEWDGSGNPVIYSNWAQGQPGGLARWTEDCACMRRTDNWQWHDYGCSQPGYSYRYICQYDLVENITTNSLLLSTQTVTPRLESTSKTKQQSLPPTALISKAPLSANRTTPKKPLSTRTTIRTITAKQSPSISRKPSSSSYHQTSVTTPSSTPTSVKSSTSRTNPQIDVSPFPVQGRTCPQTLGTEHNTVVYNGSYCYQFVDKSVTWNDALDYCQRRGGALVEIYGQETMDFIAEVLRRNFSWNAVWIGANDEEKEGEFKWRGSGREVTYSNWAPGQPSGIWTLGLEDCVALEKADGYKWHDYHCSIGTQKLKLICQYDLVEKTTPSIEQTSTASATKPTPTRATSRYMPITTTTTSETPTDTPISGSLTTAAISGTTCPSEVRTNERHVYGGQCYQFVDRAVTWVGALNDCEVNGGRLLEIYDEDTMRFIARTLTNYYRWDTVWTGANDRGKEGQFIWRGTGREVTYTNWAPAQPSGIWAFGLEDCVAFVKNVGYKWHDFHCNIGTQQFRFICQYGPLPTTSPSVPLTSSLPSQSSRKGEVTPTTSSPQTMLSQSSRKGEVTSTTSSPRTMSSQSSRKGEVTSTSTLPQTTAVDAAKGSLSLKNQEKHGVSSSNNKATYLGIGITCGAVILIAIVVIAVVWHYKRRNKYPRFQDRVQFNNNLYQLDQVSLEVSEDQNMNSKTIESVDDMYSKPDKLHGNSNSDNTDVTLMPNELYA